jgi:similar to stage IV sporulation protein
MNRMGNQEMIHWWQGYVVIQVSGTKLERLINRMMNKRLSAWNIIRSSENHARISITLKDFFQLRMLLKAIIYDMFVEEGQPVVKPNQYVKPGDLLISGVLGTEEERKIVSAKGIVLGEVWYESNITVPMTQKRSTLTGEGMKRYFLNLGPLSLKVWGFGKIPYDQYEQDKDTYSFSFKGWKIPISWASEQILETNDTEVGYTEEEAFQLGVKLGRENMYRKLQPEAEIKEENVLRKRTENGKVYIKMHYTVIEEIASEQIIIQGD